ncbi:MAG: AmmeMemoRadiSam system protein B [Spirochaetia bacterium]|nr:AmmeMemoRadiSam system protein B [Spirochaetia bacterium]
MRDNTAMETGSKLRAPIVSGIFYPEDADELARLVQDLLERVSAEEDNQISPPPDQQLRVLLVPHASYQHIGSYLARAFRLVSQAGAIERIVLVSTVHRDFEQRVWLPGFDAFRCPLADFPVDTQLIRRLNDSSNGSFSDGGSPFQINNIPFAEEHSQEILLPMLAQTAAKATILPLLLGQNSRELIQHTAHALGQLRLTNDPHTLFVISSNLSNFTDSVNAQKQAQSFLSELGKNSPDFLASRQITACGRGGLQLVQELFHGSLTYLNLEVGRSGIIQPEQREVWYGSFAGYTPIKTHTDREEL